MDGPCQRDQVGHNLKKLVAPTWLISKYTFLTPRDPGSILGNIRMVYVSAWIRQSTPQIP